MFRNQNILIGLLMVVGLVQTACSSRRGEAGRAQGIPWGVWLFAILVAGALFVWLWLSEPKKKAAPPAKPEAETPPTRSGMAAPARVAETPEAVVKRAALALSGVGEEIEEPIPKSVEPDDLKLVEGIGPKISALLQAAGMMTSAHLASTDVKRLKRIIAEAGLTALADPTTWPEQAGLAATGQWDALEALQGELRGGRRV